ncbi:hypothetical protein WJX72_006824 [[Myrmecia] bisecta]|uniref:Leucine-rich repeat-containing protein 46 n=1 Tax=[Myrmecia] bisecta TaxID=41462 RepID=A0AAW1Q7L6_9CHLO
MPGKQVNSREKREADLLAPTTLTEEIIQQASSSSSQGLQELQKFVFSRRGISKIGRLDHCINFVELDLSGNRLCRLSGLDQLQRLQKLVLTSNRLVCLDGLSALAALEHLLVQDNCLASLADLNLPQLASLPRLQSLYFQNPGGAQANPACRLPAYRESVLAALPSLRNLDGERQPAPAPAGYKKPPQAGSGRSPLKQDVSRFLPQQTPWLQDFTWEASGAAESGLAAKEAALVRSLDECHMINTVLKEEIQKLLA